MTSDEVSESVATSGFSLLRNNGSFRILWVSRSVSFLGDSLGLVALMLYTADTTGQALAVGLLLLAGDFAPSLLGPFTGTFSDRFDRKKIMLACEFAQCGLIAAIAVTLPPLPVLLVLVAVRAAVGQVFQPASRASIPTLVPVRQLGAANSTLGFGTYGSEALGPLLGAALFPFLDVRGVLLIDAATFLVSAGLLAALPRLPSGRAESGADTSFFMDARAGVAHIWSARAVRAIVLGFCAVVAFNGVDDVALVFLTRDALGGGQSAVSLVLAGVGIGLLLGYLLLARYSAGLPMVALLIFGLVVQSAGNVLTGFSWAVAAALVVQAIRGIGIAAMEVAANTLLQKMVPAAMLGRVFGNFYALIGVAAALSYTLGGIVLDGTSARFTLIAAGTGGVIAAGCTALTLPRATKDP